MKKLILLFTLVMTGVACQSEENARQDVGVSTNSNESDAKDSFDGVLPESDAEADQIQAELVKLEEEKKAIEDSLNLVDEQIGEAEKVQQEMEYESQNLSMVISILRRLLDSGVFRGIIEQFINPDLLDSIFDAIDSGDSQAIFAAFAQIIFDLISQRISSADQISAIDDEIAIKQQELDALSSGTE
ncbi:MAG: hypothetical protein HRU19_15405 [Pseudobacteriovorax sp.]|nr:hypothetical protein [Pseudobacteriovorax sp.]